MKTLHRQTYCPTEEEHIQIEQTIIKSKASAHTNQRNWLIFQIGSQTGLRLSEILHLRHQDIDFDHNLINIRAEVAKNGRESFVVISNCLKSLIIDYKARMRPSEWLFHSIRNPNKPLSNCSYTVAWHKYLLTAGLNQIKYQDQGGNKRRKILFHTASRTYFINKVFKANPNRNLAELAQVTRHKSIDCIYKYYLRFNTPELWKELVKF